MHRLITERDDLAFARLCDELYEPVFFRLKSFYRQHSLVDEALLTDIVTDSFLNYFRSPQRYQPEKQSLEKFLTMDAEGDLRNAIEKIKRLNKKFQKAVELDRENGNSETEDLSTPWQLLLDKENRSLLEQKLEELFDSDTDRAMVQLILDGERRSSEYAQLLGLEGLDESEQRKEVKRNKDRIDKVLKRKLNFGNSG